MKPKKNPSERVLPYVRYAFPVFTYLTLFACLFIPSMRFYAADERMRDKISLATLLSNAWNTCRRQLFSAAADPMPEQVEFSKVTLALIIVFSLLFLIGFAISVWALWALIDADSHQKRGLPPSRQQTLFVTLFPNRIVLFIPNLLCLPLMLFPSILPKVYDRFLMYTVRVKYIFFVSPAILALALLVIGVVLSLLSAPLEKREGLHPFSLTAKRIQKSKEGDHPLD